MRAEARHAVRAMPIRSCQEQAFGRACVIETVVIYR